MSILMSDHVMDDSDVEIITVSGTVKWFDYDKGFGFVMAAGYPDILLHSNVIRSRGQTAVSEGLPVTVEVANGARGYKVVSIVQMAERLGGDGHKAHPLGLTGDFLSRLEVLPARVKWYSTTKGFGFVNVFCRADDVFLPADILRASRLGFPMTGEALGVKVIDGDKGPLVVEACSWPTDSP